MTLTGVIVVALVVIVAVSVIVLYNRLVTLRNRCDNSWAQIDVQLRRRYDLIPNLVETVKGYAAHERETLESVVQARAAAMAAGGVGERSAAENALSSTLRSLFAVAEAYPDLKANQSFLDLQAQLTDRQDRLRAAVLQRLCHELQHGDADLPLQHPGGSLRLPRQDILRGGGEREGTGERPALTASATRSVRSS